MGLIMAGITQYKSLRDTGNGEDYGPISQIDAYALSLSSKGNVNPANPQHAGFIENVRSAVASGLVSEQGVNNIAKYNPSLAPILFTAYSAYKAQSESSPEAKRRKILGQYFSPETPEKPFTEQDVGSGIGPMRIGQPIPGTGQPAKRDTQNAVNALLRSGDIAGAKSLLETIQKGGESAFAKINPKEYTQESVRKFAQTGDYASLVPTEDKTAREDKTFTQEGALRDDFTKLSAPFIQVRDSYGRIKESAKNPSPAGDLALIFNYMKMLDPGSTVREGEFATAQNSAGIPERVRAMYNRSISGERLSDKTRDDFVGRSEALYKRQAYTHKKLESQFKSLAKQYGLQQERVVPDYTSDIETPANSPTGSARPRVRFTDLP